jgi:hypothetical protein
LRRHGCELADDRSIIGLTSFNSPLNRPDANAVPRDLKYDQLSGGSGGL